MPYELCRHVKTNGLRCQSPALTEEPWCYFHHRLITRHRHLNEARTDRTTLALHLPALEDRESIQVALSLVTDALLNGVLPEKRATVLLRAIAIASRNAANIVTQPYQPDKVVRATSLTQDGLHLDQRRMNDNSQLPALQRPRSAQPGPAQLGPVQPGPAQPGPALALPESGTSGHTPALPAAADAVS